MIAAMDQAVAKSALVQASTCYGHDNSYIADAVAAHPNRFTPAYRCSRARRSRKHSLLGWPQPDWTTVHGWQHDVNRADWVDDGDPSLPGSASELGIPRHANDGEGDSVSRSHVGASPKSA